MTEGSELVPSVATHDLAGAEETRLRRLFRRLLVVALAAPAGVAVVAAGACTSSAQPSAPDACTPQPTTFDAQITFCGTEQAPYCDAGAPCETFLVLPCGPPPDATARTSCYLSFAECGELCPGLAYACQAVGGWCADGAISSDRGPAVIECTYCLNAAGRRPRGLRIALPLEAPRDGASMLADYLARASHLEAASVIAFRGLRGELRRHGAPAELVLGAHRAACDEVRHARVMARLARARGASPPPVSAAPAARQTLTAMVLENAVEGCVRETFGALVAHWQAEHARDGEIADAMREIAVDETRHAALSWAIARWAYPELSTAQRRRLARATKRAVRALHRESRRAAPRTLATLAGLPPAAVQSTWLRALETELWARPVDAPVRG